MTRQLIHITINFTGEIDGDALKKVLDRAVDWIHYMPNCWIVLTTSDADRWAQRLYPLLGDNDTMMVMPLDPHQARGWLQRWVIDWIEAAKERVKEVDQPFLPGMPTQKKLPPKSA